MRCLRLCSLPSLLNCLNSTRSMNWQNSIKPPLKVFVPGPEAIAAGREIFESNKCFNCHKVFWEGNSDRGPNLGTKQIGLYYVCRLHQGTDSRPAKKQSPGFEDKKSKKAMPTYYGEDLNEAELNFQALVAYLKTMRDPTHICRSKGNFPNQWTWWDDKQIVEEGKVVFEGKEPATEGLNCAVCHGADGIPMMTGAFDFRDPNNPDTKTRCRTIWTSPSRIFRTSYITNGSPGVSTTHPWLPGAASSHICTLWKAEAYARTFHDPLDKRDREEDRYRPSPPKKKSNGGKKRAYSSIHCFSNSNSADT